MAAGGWRRSRDSGHLGSCESDNFCRFLNHSTAGGRLTIDREHARGGRRLRSPSTRHSWRTPIGVEGDVRSSHRDDGRQWQRDVRPGRRFASRSAPAGAREPVLGAERNVSSPSDARSATVWTTSKPSMVAASAWLWLPPTWTRSARSGDRSVEHVVTVVDACALANALGDDQDDGDTARRELRALVRSLLPIWLTLRPCRCCATGGCAARSPINVSPPPLLTCSRSVSSASHPAADAARLRAAPT